MLVPPRELEELRRSRPAHLLHLRLLLLPRARALRRLRLEKHELRRGLHPQAPHGVLRRGLAAPEKQTMRGRVEVARCDARLELRALPRRVRVGVDLHHVLLKPDRHAKTRGWGRRHSVVRPRGCARESVRVAQPRDQAKGRLGECARKCPTDDWLFSLPQIWTLECARQSSAHTPSLRGARRNEPPRRHVRLEHSTEHRGVARLRGLLPLLRLRRVRRRRTGNERLRGGGVFDGTARVPWFRSEATLRAARARARPGGEQDHPRPVPRTTP